MTDLATCNNAIGVVIAMPLYNYTNVELELVNAHIANCPTCREKYNALRPEWRAQWQKRVGDALADPRTMEQRARDDDWADLKATQESARP